MMKTAPLVVSVCALFIMATGAEAGDLSLYSRTGYMTWTEKESGRQFIRESGPTEEIGLSYTWKTRVVDFNGKLGLWGSVLGYNGSSAETEQPQKMTTGDFGGKGEVILCIPFRATESIEIAPVAGTGVNYFWRSVGPEKWLVLSSKAGARIKVGPVEVLGGVLYPYKTSDTIDWTDIGAASKVTVEPKGMTTPFVEAKAKTGQWEFSVFYEPMRWSSSEKAPFSYTGQNVTAAIANVSGIYQPETYVQHMGISVGYHF